VKSIALFRRCASQRSSIEYGSPMCAGRRYIGSSFMESITSSTNKKSGYWQSFMGDGIRVGWKNGANKFDKLVCARRARHPCLAFDLRFV
jgi:hypothetical protein